MIRPLPARSIKLLVFDLDGTLIDSTVDLCNSVNATLVHFDRARLPNERITSFVGNGVQMLVQRAFFNSLASEVKPVDQDLLAAALQFFLDYYRVHKLDFTYAYEGVLDSLESLQALPDGGLRKMAVLTNKPVRPSQAICDALGMGKYFFRVYGGDSFVAKKPDPMGLRALMDEAGVGPEETLMIGDSEVDVRTARNAGAWILGCTFGLAPQSLKNLDIDALADHPADWTAALNPDQSSKADSSSEEISFTGGPSVGRGEIR